MRLGGLVVGGDGGSASFRVGIGVANLAEGGQHDILADVVGVHCRFATLDANDGSVLGSGPGDLGTHGRRMLSSGVLVGGLGVLTFGTVGIDVAEVVDGSQEGFGAGTVRVVGATGTVHLGLAAFVSAGYQDRAGMHKDTE